MFIKLSLEQNLLNQGTQSITATTRSLTYVDGRVGKTVSSVTGTVADPLFSFNKLDAFANFFVEFWLKVDGSPNGMFDIMQQGTINNGSSNLLYIYQGKLQFWYSASSSSPKELFNIDHDNQWHLITIQKVGYNVAAWKDGVLLHNSMLSESYPVINYNTPVRCFFTDFPTYSTHPTYQVDEIRIEQEQIRTLENFTVVVENPPSGGSTKFVDGITSTVVKGTPITLTVNPANIAAITEVAADSFYNSLSNWKQIRFIFKHSLGNQQKIVTFENNGSDSFANVDLLFSSKSRAGSWVLKRIHLVDFDGADFSYSVTSTDYNFILI